MALPRSYEAFKRSYSQVWQAYDRLGGVLHDAGPLDEKSRELVKLGISIGGKLEGAVHSHTARALKAGATADEIRHVVLLALTTVGFPSMMAALTWVEDILKTAGSRKEKTKS